MAKAGFNILLASRSAQKLAAAEADIKVKCPGTEVRVVSADLGSDLGSLLAQRDAWDNLGILINNAG